MKQTIGYKTGLIHNVILDKYNTIYNSELNKYIRLSEYDFLIKENDLDYIRHFGDGIKSITLVGELFEPGE